MVESRVERSPGARAGSAVGAARGPGRLSPSTILVWAMRLAVVGVAVWGAFFSLRSGRLTAEAWRDLFMFGLSQGSVYALLALGYTMVYGILRFINFAHGEVFMGGAMLGWAAVGPLVYSGLWFRDSLLSLVLLFAACVAGSAALAGMLERVAYRPLRRAPRLSLFVTSIGASFFLQYAFRGIFGTNDKAIPPLPVLDGWWDVLGFRLFRSQALVMAVTALALLLLYLLIERTKTGLAIRAVGEDQGAAALMGVDVDRTIAHTFVIGGAMAGVAGFIRLVMFARVDFVTGFIPGIKAFTAAVIGGIGNIPGAVVGGFVLGLFEGIGPSLILHGLGIPSPWQVKDVLVFSALIVVLIFRPTGILGERVARDVP